MEVNHDSLYRHSTAPAVQSQTIDHLTTVRGLENASDQSVSVNRIDESLHAGILLPAAVGSPAISTAVRIGDKRKRGRPARGQMVMAPNPKPRAPPKNKVEEDEDVCFICFDGGSLVLCDRKGCPKAYHPACIKRDEAFFESTPKWYCGWHICSVCLKTSQYMCYTCTYSLCKGCTKDEDYVRVRGNMGFCTICMKTIMLIENKDLANKASVDFDDITSWEYLFKVYWILLKEKLSLTLDDLTKAKSPYKGVISNTHHVHNVNGFNSNKPHEHLTLNKPIEQVITTVKASNENGQVKTEPKVENNENTLLITNNKRQKTENKVENNVDEYAAIDVHNINMIYLRSNLMENLIKDEKLEDKIVGLIVRIRISTSDNKQDLCRLVQVIGVNKVDKIGEKTVNTMLEVLNLNKKENIAIDTISNQDFSEEECKNLRQSMKCGLVKRLTVGEIQNKAIKLQMLRLNDKLEGEILKLNHLHEQASEMSRKNELRECIKKLQLLKEPEECSQIPEVHVDPKMNPDYESEEETEGLLNNITQTQDKYNSPNDSELSRCEDKPTSLTRKVIKEDEANARSKPETPTIEVPFSPNDNETDLLWHYRDPSGNIQGPFSMIQLRKWSTTGYFPPDMRIWRIDEHDDSLLLTDAINSSFHTAAHLLYSFSLQCQQLGAATNNNRIDSSDIAGSENINSPSECTQSVKDLQSSKDSKDSPSECTQSMKDLQSSKENEFVASEGLGSISSGSTMSVVSEKNVEPESSQHSEELKDNNNNNTSSSDYSQVSHLALEQGSMPSPSTSLSPENHVSPQNVNENENENENENVNENENENENEKQLNCKSYERQSSGQNWRPFVINLNLNDCGLSPATKSDSFEHDNDVNVSTHELELPGPTPKENGSNHVFEDLAIEKPEPVFTEVTDLPQPMNIADSGGPSWSTSSTLVQLPMVAPNTNTNTNTEEWGRYSMKSSVDEWSSGLDVSLLSLKQPDVNTSLPTSNASSWHGMLETIEFSTLAEESVSDLLAEVDAMEFQYNLGSPTSAMRYREEASMKSCKNECFEIGDLSPSPDPGKSDALSSTGDLHLPCDEQQPGMYYDMLKLSSNGVQGQNSNNQGGEGVSHFYNPRSSRTIDLDINDTFMPHNMDDDTVWGRLPGHVNLDWGAQTRYTDTGPVDYFQGGDKSRPFWDRSKSVCKFYESGHCKKGASCQDRHI